MCARVPLFAESVDNILGGDWLAATGTFWCENFFVICKNGTRAQQQDEVNIRKTGGKQRRVFVKEKTTKPRERERKVCAIQRTHRHTSTRTCTCAQKDYSPFSQYISPFLRNKVVVCAKQPDRQEDKKARRSIGRQEQQTWRWVRIGSTWGVMTS